MLDSLQLTPVCIFDVCVGMQLNKDLPDMLNLLIYTCELMGFDLTARIHVILDTYYVRLAIMRSCIRYSTQELYDFENMCYGVKFIALFC